MKASSSTRRRVTRRRADPRGLAQLDALAARLTEIVREARALGGGYRGHERVRVSTDEEEALDDEEVVAEKQRRR